MLATTCLFRSFIFRTCALFLKTLLRLEQMKSNMQQISLIPLHKTENVQQINTII